MLLHHYLQQLADIFAHANRQRTALLAEISDPKIRAAVDDWEPGDPIPSDYPQQEAKPADAPDTEASDEPKASGADTQAGLSGNSPDSGSGSAQATQGRGPAATREFIPGQTGEGAIPPADPANPPA